MIPVTKSFLPPIDVYTEYLKKAWDNKIITNRGALVIELENKLKSYFNLSHLLCTNNGTIPIQIALKLFANGGEVITTPFSYVATTAAIKWENCTPVFVDIDPAYWTIDETKIEDAITEKTTCILATHVFGNPCNIEVIGKIAKRYNLKVIYDAAHCFGVDYNGQSIFNYGDISTCSFHATKIFHTAEGGALICNNKGKNDEVFALHNFGHKGKLEFSGLGINAKMSELSAAMGLSILPNISLIFERRKNIVNYYYQNLNFKGFKTFKLRENSNSNYSYYPIVFESKINREKAEHELKLKNIIPRRYFFPSLNQLPYTADVSMPISESISERILCIPLYHSLSNKEQLLIVNTLNSLT
tara:strand:- start:6109 stop:7182 length:1074 start_codon:yes stop_codon:yes gene_type:complete